MTDHIKTGEEIYLNIHKLTEGLAEGLKTAPEFDKACSEQWVSVSWMKEQLKDFEFYMMDISPRDYPGLKKHFIRCFCSLLEEEDP